MFNYQAGGADYCFSKAVVHDLTKLLAYECAPYGINVNGVAPGIIDTPMHGRPREETEARHAGRIPLGRVGVPEDVAGIAVFPCEPCFGLHHRPDRSRQWRDVDEWLSMQAR